MHFDYDLDIKLNPDKYDTKISIESHYYTVLLSDDFTRFLVKIFSVFSSSKYYLNRYDIDKIFETVYGKLSRQARRKLFRRLPLPARRAGATSNKRLAAVLDVSLAATSVITISSARIS